MHLDKYLGLFIEGLDTGHGMEGFEIRFLETGVGKDKDVGGLLDVGLAQCAWTDRYPPHKEGVGIGVDCYEIRDHHGVALGKLRVVGDDMQQLVGKGGVFTDHDMVFAIYLGRAQTVSMHDGVQLFRRQGDEVGVTIDPGDDGDGPDHPSLQGDR